MFKKALVAVTLLMLPVTGAFAQTAAQSDIGFLLAQGSTYGSYTCPAAATSPCFVQYGSAIPVTGSFSPSGTQDVNITQTGGVTQLRGAGAVGTGSERIAVGQDVTTIAGSAPGTTASPSTNALSSVDLSSAASTAGVAPVSSSALASNTVIKAGAGNLYSFEVSADSTLSAAAWYIMIYNATSAPADGAVTPAKCYAVPSGSTVVGGAFPHPAYFSTGITIAVSTTGCFTKTASVHAFISGDAQ